MRSHQVVLGFIALTLGSLLACQCSGEERFRLEAIDPGRPKGQFHDVCLTAATRSCERDEKCSSQDFRDAWFSLSECITRQTLNCELRAEDPNYQITAKLIASCTPAADLRCDAEAPLEGCTIPGGAIPSGGVCYDGSSCSTGYCMPAARAGRLQMLCGTCEQLCTPACDGEKGEFCFVDVETRKSYCRGEDPEGTACTGSCGQFTFCIEGVCRRGRNLDEPCDPGNPTTAPCLYGDTRYCDPVSRVCRPRSKVGEACDNNAATAPPCYWWDHCSRTGYCRKVQLAWYDEPCGISGDDRVDCRGWARCTATTARPEGRCIRPAEDGTLCDPNQRLNCLPPAQCIGGFCRYPKLDYCSLEPAD